MEDTSPVLQNFQIHQQSTAAHPHDHAKHCSGPKSRLDEFKQSSSVVTGVLAGVSFVHKYRIICLLGKGGFSSVYLARDEETKIDIAIKIDTTPVLILPRDVQSLPPELRSQEMSSMLEDSSQYKVARAMLFALREFHSFGLVHRDVKPGNFCHPTAEEALLVRKEDTKTQSSAHEAVKAYLIDYGFAKAAPQNSAEQHLIDQFVGTPDYASCSALMGRRQRAKDDIESLGYSLLEMYLGCGTLPWDITVCPDSSWNAKRKREVAAQPGYYDHLTPSQWTKHALKRMAERKLRMWRTLTTGGINHDGASKQSPAPRMIGHQYHLVINFGSGVSASVQDVVPGFLKDWINYSLSVSGCEDPTVDYEYLDGLILKAAQEALPPTAVRLQRQRFPASSVFAPDVTPVVYHDASKTKAGLLDEEVGDSFSLLREEAGSMCVVASNTQAEAEGEVGEVGSGIERKSWSDGDGNVYRLIAGSLSDYSCWGDEAAAQEDGHPMFSGSEGRLSAAAVQSDGSGVL
ncbi:hypothetical protein CEUSTIGMA_g4611.t1 [Chlamydomonas eustigma]|uniref:Protein kinase domain-containing protein n=1 Tax=Chlamydomonas eustigma TaxID=1157962 RepID=A0A250X285_9CHLO|nr:hypothetical protein CEUSTIGMA_g4611.t1 [Chlamydomonas eustigma]|eukprot:GAX77166.1 hypothetical protein CEUSTIGMA_g4611.t1 [Chlamydomonas eustigma]